ncbi:PH domain-containing protein [Siminovitchia sp. 179-K 8D1 HS]|uniref:PH domain-containing protein n=1 Tax=Siminovitchia sp. 179-K 8D1 HS TaxID=3142385 RepID=UPI0039A107F8
MKMPSKRISKRGLKVWRITGGILSLIAWVIAIGVGVAAYHFDWPVWIVIVTGLLALGETVSTIWIIPSIRWKRWRYEVNEHELELQHGVIFVHRTLVPMVRVQHVDTSQGPILKKYDLATVSISTAATTHEIPAVDVREAEELRRLISALARVAKDDV